MDAIVTAYRRESDPWKGFRAGVQASLTISCRSDVQRITLIDAPSAIGWQAMREIENRSTMRLLDGGLQRLVDDGWIEARPIEPLANFLFGGMCELAMAVTHSNQPRKAKAAAAAELDRIIDGLATKKTGARVAAEPAS
ncbi:hypothetical protein [Mycobacterium simiae]|uniref:hypothetical protein n=1 Tax=Mycobacterium simiae TaxID=1784 RepID=UPI00349FD2FD